MHRRRDDPLDPATLLSAYAQGAFPMSEPGTDRVRFFTCPVRCVFPLATFRPSGSLARRVRSGRFEISVNRDFAAVMSACATDRGRQNRTWISPSMQAAYVELHRLGHAHSVEARRDGRLVGGLYGVTLGGAFFGESMFVRPDLGGTDASKVCLVHLVGRLRERGFVLLDSQFANDHVLRLGAVEIPAEDYLRSLAGAIGIEATFA